MLAKAKSSWSRGRAAAAAVESACMPMANKSPWHAKEAPKSSGKSQRKAANTIRVTCLNLQKMESTLRRREF